MTSYYDKEEDYSDYDLMPPEEGQRPRVPRGKKYPEKRGQIVNTAAYGFHPDEFKIALTSMKRGGKRLGSVFGFPDSGRGLKRKGPKDGLSLWDRLNETRNNIKRPDDIVNCYVSGVTTKERRRTFSPRYAEEEYMGKREKQPYGGGLTKDDLKEAVREELKGVSKPDDSATDDSEQPNGQQGGEPQKDFDPLEEFSDWASQAGIDVKEVATGFSVMSADEAMDKHGQRACPGCALKNPPSEWSAFCEECSVRY